MPSNDNRPVQNNTPSNTDTETAPTQDTTSSKPHLVSKLEEQIVQLEGVLKAISSSPISKET